MMGVLGALAAMSAPLNLNGIDYEERPIERRLAFKPQCKTQLTKKQKKVRAANKAAGKMRARNRKSKK